MPKLVIAAGGTGGHMFPAQALAHVMQDRGWQVALSTDRRGATYTQYFSEDTQIRIMNVARIDGGIAAKLTLPFRLLRSIVSELCWMRAFSPDVVIGLGGYPSFPALSAARFLRIPSLIHEQNSVLGRVNRIFSSSVKTIACGLPLTRPPSNARVVLTGNPLRQTVLEAVTDYVPSDTFNLLCFGGSQGASIFATLIPQMIDHLPKDFQQRLSVTLQAREADQGQAADALKKNALHSFEVAPFFQNMPQRIAKSDLVICRGGASTLAEITAIGRAALIVPLPSAMDDHQTTNAQSLAKAGAAVVYPQDTLDSKQLAHDIMQITPDILKKMATAARGLGKPNATQELACLVQDVL